MGLRHLGVGLGFWALLATPAAAASLTLIRHAAWTAADDRDYGEFIAAIGASGCRTVDACLHDKANVFAASDPKGVHFRSDCADLPYVLRFYYAWHRGLPFSYVTDVAPRGRASDIRYSPRGNQVESRRDVLTGTDALSVLNVLRDGVSSAAYRIDPELEAPLESDFYSPAVGPRSIRPGTTIYDPNGHLAVIWKVEADGRLRYIDAHPDNSLTRGFYDLRFVRSSPGMGAGFKNWRPARLEGALPRGDGALVGGHIRLAKNEEIHDFSLTQFYGTEGDWEDYSTPSRDARLKTAFKELRDNAERFMTMHRAGDTRLAYRGNDLAGDMLAAYDGAAAGCRVSYVRSDGSNVSFGYEEARRRLFGFSFDPYQCAERRWGAEGAELSTCLDGLLKRAWYAAEQSLRNQIDRTYEVRMDWTLTALQTGDERIGVKDAPDTDVRAFLVAQKEKPDAFWTPGFAEKDLSYFLAGAGAGAGASALPDATVVG